MAGALSLAPSDAIVALTLVGLLALYVGGVRRVWSADAAYWPLRTKRGRLPVWRVALGLVGLALIGAGMSSAAFRWAGEMLALHSLQHHVLATLGAPLVVLGQPALAFGAWLPPWRRARLAAAGRRIVASPLVRWTVGRPLVVWLAHVAVLWTGYLPGVHGILHAHGGLHAVHHVALLTTALAFWWLLIGATPTWLPTTRAQRVVATLAAWLQNNALSALIAFSALSNYPEYAARRPHWGLTPQEAHYVAGAVQYLPAEVVYLFTLSVLAFGWLCEIDDSTAQPADHPRPAAAPDRPARSGLRARREQLIREEWEM